MQKGGVRLRSGLNSFFPVYLCNAPFWADPDRRKKSLGHELLGITNYALLPGDSRHRRVKDDDFSSGTMNFGMAALVEMHNN
jgi:hypothetical protein